MGPTCAGQSLFLGSAAGLPLLLGSAADLSVAGHSCWLPTASSCFSTACTTHHAPADERHMPKQCVLEEPLCYEDLLEEEVGCVL